MKDMKDISDRTHQRGNAYLVTVMVMVIVTLLGLSLGAVTQTEMLIGSRQKTNQTVFYAAEAGVNLALARFMVQGETKPALISWTVPPAYSTGIPLQSEIHLAPVLPITMPVCNLCEGSESTEANPDSLHNIRSPITVRAFLETDSGQVLAQRRVSTFVDILPWKVPETLAAGGSLENQRNLVEFD